MTNHAPTRRPNCIACGGPAPVSPEDSSHDDCFQVSTTITTRWQGAVKGYEVWASAPGTATRLVGTYDTRAEARRVAAAQASA